MLCGKVAVGDVSAIDCNGAVAQAANAEKPIKIKGKAFLLSARGKPMRKPEVT